MSVMDIYLHKACGHPVAEYLGDGKPDALQSDEWRVLGNPVEWGSENLYVCPACGFLFRINAKQLVKVEA